MKDNQENKQSMYRATEKVLNDNNTIYTGFTALEDAKDELAQKILDIQAAAQLQDDIITGIATDKQILKTGLIDIASLVAGKVQGYATVTNNSELFNAVNFSRTQLDRTRDELLGQRCQNIHDKANTNLAALAAYGVTAPLLATLQSSITSYITKTPEPRAAKAAKKAVTLQLRQLFKDTDKILKLRIDKFMLQYKTSHPNFYNSYKTARIIIDLGSTTTKIKVQVKDGNGNPVAGANVGLFQNNFPIYSKTANADGKPSITKVKPGTYQLRVEKNGFITQTQSGIAFLAGKSLTRTITLMPGTASGGGTVNVEGTVQPNTIQHADLSGVNPNLSTTIHVEITGNGLRIYASVAAGDAPDTIFWDVNNGTDVIKALTEFAALTGVTDDKHEINIQNLGPNPGHFKFTFNNVG